MTRKAEKTMIGDTIHRGGRGPVFSIRRVDELLRRRAFAVTWRIDL